MTNIAIIPARGGSVGLPGKNIADLGGHPLIVWTIRAAKASDVFHRIVVSTESEDIARISRKAGVEVLVRPAELATSKANSTDVVRHALDAIPATMFALLQPTSPFRSAFHIREATKRARERSRPVVSVSAIKPLSWSYHLVNGTDLVPALDQPPEPRRQDAPITVAPNGGIYVCTTDHLQRTGVFAGAGAQGYVMGRLDSIDIDEPEDLELARAVVRVGLRTINPAPATPR